MSTPSERPLVSIIVPCKNAGAYLDECLSSIIAQTYINWEVIIIDDHSTDNSWTTLQIWANKHISIKPLRNNQRGIISALRLAYSNSKGDLITRMDADDIMTPNKLDIMVSQLIDHGSGNIATGKVEYFRNDRPLGNGYLRYANWLNFLSSKGSNLDEVYKECVIASPCWMLYRDDLDAIGAFESDVYPEDYDLVFRMYQHRLKVLPCNEEILHLWRDHGSRASRNDDNYKDNRFLELKVDYLLKIDFKNDIPLVLWGAGRKAKTIAKILISKEIKFKWITDNEKKIGHEVYGVIISATSILFDLDKTQIILTVANPEEQKEIKNRIKSLPFASNHQSYWFC